MKKGIVLTGVKCSGTPHIGNYLGAIKPAIDKANAGAMKSFFFMADYHALNQTRSADELRRSVMEIACTWLACGLDPNKTVFYRQSDVPEVFELSTIIGNLTPKGMLNRAHSYKAAVQANLDTGRDADDDVNIGLYTYPVLMAADILIMDADLVPVGADQKQHIEMAADIAKAFNAVFGQTLTVPKELIRKEVAIIPGLDGRKMSKSYHNTIPLFCSEQELKKMVMRITTDSSAPAEAKPHDHLIFQLYRHFTGKEPETQIGWGEAKQKLFEVLNAYLSPIRAEYNRLMQNYSEVEQILTRGAVNARVQARKTLDRVRKAIGAS